MYEVLMAEHQLSVNGCGSWADYMLGDRSVLVQAAPLFQEVKSCQLLAPRNR